MSNINLLTELVTNGYKENLFFLVSLLSIFFAILVLISKNPIISVLFLIALFFTVSCYLIILGLHFIGLSYLLVYVGAISILFLFILMLINIRVSELTTDNSNSIPLGLIAGFCFVVPISSQMPFDIFWFQILNFRTVNKFFGNDSSSLESNLKFEDFSDKFEAFGDKEISFISKSWDSNVSETTHIATIGNYIYNDGAIQLIVISLILLLAMVGAIVITIKKTPNRMSK